MKKYMILIAVLLVGCSGAQVSKTQVDAAADTFCALHEQNKALEARYGITPQGTHAKVEKGADTFCALRAAVKEVETSSAAGSAGISSAGTAG